MRNKSVPDAFEEIDAELITSNADIYINKQGVPHIVSATDDAMFFAMGYFNARERLWSMEQWKLTAMGRIAEIYGEQYLNVDLFMRIIDLPKIATMLYQNADNETKQVLTAYTNGINTYIRANKDELSFEYGASDFTPEEWKPSDCFLMQRYLTFILDNNFYYDLIMAKIANKIGVSKAMELLPSYPATAPHILDPDINKHINDTIIPVLDTTNTLAYTTSSDDALLNELASIMQMLGKCGSNLGSNTWATNINPNNAILANDSHLPLALPCFWQQIHISSPSYNVVGLMIPGIPIILSGRNNSIVWGVANMMVDDIDYLIQRIDSNQQNYYINTTETKPIVEFVDTIKIRNAPPYLYYKRSINGCNILSDAAILNNYTNAKSNPMNYFTFQWTATQKTNEIGAMLKTMKATNWKEFVSGVNNWKCPGMVFTYADVKGNIGIAPRALLPLRKPAVTPSLPSPGWLVGNVWTGFIEPNAIPTLYNPPKRFVSASNNAVDKSATYFITSYDALGARAERIEEMITASEAYTYRDAQYMHNDVLSLYARKMLQRLFPIFDKYQHLLSKDEKNAFARMRKWDYTMSLNSVPASIFNMYIAKLIEETLADELGELYSHYISNTNMPMQKIYELLMSPESTWWLNTNTQERQQRDYMVIHSFKTAIAELRKLYKTDTISKWKYGEQHTVTLNHLYTYNTMFHNATDIGEFQLGGSNCTINNTDWNLSTPFKIISATAMRLIADMKADYIYTIIPGGSSGDPVHPHYADQVQLWQIGTYIKLPTDAVPAPEFELAVSLRHKQ
jgi:penicillin amidase